MMISHLDNHLWLTPKQPSNQEGKKGIANKVFADFWLNIGSVIRAACKFVTFKHKKWISAHINPQPYELKKFQVFS